MRICFFAKVDSPEVLERVNFYAQDIRILRELGYEVVVATRLKDIPFGCDLYYIWWWSWAFQPLLKAKGSRSPTIITGVFDYERPSIMQAGGFYLDRPWWQRLLIRWSLRQANANVFLSRFEEKQITRIFGIQTSSYAPCAVDTDRYFPIPGDKLPLILNVAWSGKLNAERKCLPQIVAALPAIRRHYPNVRLIMAGKQGEYHPRLIELAEHYGVADAIDFLGVISEEYKIALMQQAAVYLQPSLFEGFGLATAEAMACGAAVVSSPVGAVPEVIGDAGLLIAGDEPDVIADAVIRVLADDTLMRELGTRARARIVRDYGYEQRKQLIKAVIEEQVL